MKRRTSNLLLVGVIILSGCQLFEEDFGCPDLTVNPSPSDNTNLVGPVWVLQFIEVCDGSAIMFDQERPHTIQFGVDGFGGSLCDAYGGAYYFSENNTINTSAVYHTALCSHFLLYNENLGLGETFQFDISGETIRLINSADKIVWVLNKQDPALSARVDGLER